MNRVNSDKRGDDKMIIQTGMRTDIPAFYSKWFLNRIKEGYVCVRNPYNPKQVTKYSLSPEVVDLIAFCTKNPPVFIFFRRISSFSAIGRNNTRQPIVFICQCLFNLLSKHGFRFLQQYLYFQIWGYGFCLG